MKNFRITHRNSDQSEEVTQETIDALTKANLLRNYTVQEVTPAKRPSENLTDEPKPKAPAGK